MSKKQKTAVLCAAALFALNCFSVNGVSAADGAEWKEFYVSAAGSDSNTGTSEDLPFRTLEKARDSVREISADMQGDIVVNILGEGGTLFLDKPFRLYTEDSAHNGYRIIYRGIPAPGKELAEVSAGTPITGWRESEDYPGLWEAKVTDEDITHIRQLYVNNHKSFMAQSDTEVTGLGFYKKKGSKYSSDGMYVSRSVIGEYKNPDDVELWWTRNWKHVSCAVKDIYPDPFDDARLIVEMQQNFWSARSARPESSLTMTYSAPFRILNAFELLDIPGEHYFNEKTRTLYYMPREDEDMRSAEVIAPKHDKIIKIKGNDIDEKVKDITFENLMLAHVAYNAPAYGGIEIGQSTLTEVNNGVTGVTQGAVHLNMTDGITFRNNYFYGFGAVGMDLFNGDINTTVIGNAFSDFAETAFVAGNNNHTDEFYPGGISQPAPDPAPSELNLISGYTRMWSSYYGRENDGPGMADLRGDISKNWVDEYTFSITWPGSPTAMEDGIANFVKYDFDDEYTISEIRLGFDPKYVEDAAKSNFEVLLSNDFLFREGSYDVVATQLEPADSWAVYHPSEKTKYRYMMIRSVDKGLPLKLSGVYAFTPDRKPHTTFERCRNIRFENNYVRRVSDTHYGGAGVNYYYLENSKFLHNEVEDNPYSGFSMGWGWRRQPTGSHDVELAYNRFKNTSLAIHDGGAMYIMASHPNATMHDNYSYYNVGGIGTYYLDEGMDFSEWYNNVAVYNNNYLLANQTGLLNNVHDFFSTDLNYSAANKESSPKNTTLISYADPAPKAMYIMDNSGLEPEFSHIKAWVDDAQIRLTQEEYRLERTYEFGSLARTLLNSALTDAATILSEDRFGDMPWQYPIHYKYELEAMKREAERAAGSSNGVYGYKAQQIRLLMVKMDSEYQRLSLDELIKYAESLLNEAAAAPATGFGSYPGESVRIFEQKLRNAKTIAAGNADFEKKYSELQRLENACEELAGSRTEADIKYIYAEDMIGCEVDDSAKTVELVFPYGTELEKRQQLSFDISSNCVVAVESKEFELAAPVEIPIYNIPLGKSEIWTVNTRIGSSDTDWRNRSDTQNSVIGTKDGVYLAPRFHPHMEAHVAEGETKTVDIVPTGTVARTDLTFIIAAGAKDGMDIHSDRSCYDRYELSVQNDTMELSSVRSGVREIIAKDMPVSPLKTGTSNIFDFCLKKEGGKVRLEVYQDRAMVVNTLISDTRAEGYFGIRTENQGLLIKDASQNGTAVAMPFTDVERDRWSADYINDFYKRKIISGTGDGRFEPSREVTREEFLKMLLESYDVETDGAADTVFTDVEPDSWSARYISAAARHGIVNGISETEFGMGQKITRQDMAVMMYRAAKVFGPGIESSGSAASAEDYTEISDYSRSAVDALYSKGVLEGNESGMFMPKSNATREQSVKALYELKNI